MPKAEQHLAAETMRIDKWLWAARFFKTRSIAKSAIEGGKVHFDGERVKVSKEVRVGMELTIQQGFEKKTVVIKAISGVRGPAPVAQLLYEETEVSLAKRDCLHHKESCIILLDLIIVLLKKIADKSVNLNKKMINNLTSIGHIMMIKSVASCCGALDTTDIE